MNNFSVLALGVLWVMRVYVCGESSGSTEVEVKLLGFSKNETRWWKNTYVREVSLGAVAKKERMLFGWEMWMGD
ncbi:uncharacterized protein MONOS_10271c1 [Monocercomonoides exilis]|uniref:uncharacterized protein n=1 Tax=Monocercomonoides exilis TaxID=2049356 RepID=UPI00355947DC|nr:hypothetical protein MONOS_10271c3 [Monocercomonoides exilis]KAH7814780.1 hypothetical protein MONOS_10271c4 [Monocercomonoides exilis]KAH7815849.1 hypothetical protein MONOS_10271c2 [Monocercomonoides exilis]KAH7819947.1 hypothetical protein MONOS_10271c1 [Monocercomonoides exilis]|eukprot:MONOS_10271.1-p1 / transcript=MONOS_10271.1 / gene=MONOS_10271 / organism=Monocercomonoides_exilis_PA203 / gene_product=unspecified product / transcript_product=unspecified product / location=Mono_scaffold00459:39386-39607(-) / protein_length=74 / sequence_SO=supercontig / SO=protein_coding / is_pseudo=false